MNRSRIGRIVPITLAVVLSAIVGGAVAMRMRPLNGVMSLMAVSVRRHCDRSVQASTTVGTPRLAGVAA